MRLLGITYDGGKTCRECVNIDKITHVSKYKEYEKFPDHMSLSEVEEYGIERIEHPRMLEWGVRIHLEGGDTIDVPRTYMKTIVPKIHEEAPDGKIVLLRAGNDEMDDRM